MNEEFDIVTEKLNNTLITINKLLLSISEDSEEIKNLIAIYYNTIIEIEPQEEYNLKFPYFGLKEEIIFRSEVTNNLGILIKNLSSIKYNNQILNKLYLELLKNERQLYITYGKLFFEPLSWNIWEDFANKKLISRNDLIYTLILSIRLLQEDYPENVLDEFYDLEDICEDLKYEILDLMANYHIEQRYINDYFINNLVYNFAKVIENP